MIMSEVFFRQRTIIFCRNEFEHIKFMRYCCYKNTRTSWSLITDVTNYVVVILKIKIMKFIIPSKATQRLHECLFIWCVVHQN